MTIDLFEVLAKSRRRDVLALLADRKRAAGDIAARFETLAGGGERVGADGVDVVRETNGSLAGQGGSGGADAFVSKCSQIG